MLGGMPLVPCPQCHRHVARSSPCPFCSRRTAGLAGALITAASLLAAACQSKPAEPVVTLPDPATQGSSTQGPPQASATTTTPPPPSATASPPPSATATATTPAPERPKPKYGMPQPMRPAPKYGMAPPP